MSAIVRGNDRWFTIEEIADFFGERPPLMPLVVAVNESPGTGNFERDGEGRVRHI